MTAFHNLRLWGLAAIVAAAAVPAHGATQFYFQFDAQGPVAGDGPLVPPIVGTGIFVSPVDLGLGTYDLTDLAGFSLGFSFTNGRTYDTADIATPLTGVAVRIEDAGSGGQRLFFTESGGIGSDGGLGGALDLTHEGNILSFEPSFFGGNFLYGESSGGGEGGDSQVGRYVALSPVPEPASWTLMIGGFAALGHAMRRRPRLRLRLA